jgi:hypothetical protein
MASWTKAVVPGPPSSLESRHSSNYGGSRSEGGYPPFRCRSPNGAVALERGVDLSNRARDLARRNDVRRL